MHHRCLTPVVRFSAEVLEVQESRLYQVDPHRPLNREDQGQNRDDQGDDQEPGAGRSFPLQALKAPTPVNSKAMMARPMSNFGIQ